MIVVCSTCQARFKVADEKIGPRGAKVRCSKCQTVFVVHKDLGVMPADVQPVEPAPPAPALPPPAGIDLDFDGQPGAGVRPNGFIADPFSRAAPTPTSAPAPDPFAGAQAPPPAHDPYGAADPFQASSGSPAAGADPFTAPDPFSGGGGGFGSVDPFEAAVASPSPGLPTSAVTDLSDLLGNAAPAAPAPGPPAFTAPQGSSGILDTGFDFDTAAGGDPALDVEPRAAPLAPEAGGVGDDLALDERTPARGIAAAPMPGYGEFAGPDSFEEAVPGLASTSGGQSGTDAADFDSFGGGFEAPPASGTSSPPAPVPARAVAPAPREGPLPVAPVETTEETAAPASGFRRTSRFRTIAVNAVSLVALLALALGILAVWRGFRPGAGGPFRPAAILGAVAAEKELFSAAQLRSGIYERPDAPPLLFVSGTAISHAAGPVEALRVRVEVVRRGAVIASGEARAGAVPTPEELCGPRDAAGLAAALERIASRVQPAVKPGDAVPFLVAIAEYPSDVAGAGLRVAMEPMTAPLPPPPPPAPEPGQGPETTPPTAPPEGAKKP